MEKFTYKTKVHRTTDHRKLSTGEKKKYEYGTINIRKIELAKHIEKEVKITVVVD